MGRRGGFAGLAVALLALAGCGDKASPVASAPTSVAPRATPAAPRTTPPPAPGTSTTPPGASPAPSARPPFVPRGVPLESAGQPADPADLAVAKGWLSALAHGRIAAAAAAFADGAVVINATPPLTLSNRRERIVFNLSFPCGAEVVDASSVKGYLLVTYRLTDRVGSKCDGAGGTAFGAIRVKGGKMTEWYRLPDPPQAPDAGAGPVV